MTTFDRPRRPPTAALSTLAAIIFMVASAPASAGAPGPTLTPEFTGALVAGQVAMEFSCIAQANQDLAVDTVLSCWTTNGYTALTTVPLGPVATAHGAATFPAANFEVCASAYSIDVFGVHSDTTRRCVDG